jgi:hypothetical protein
MSKCVKRVRIHLRPQSQRLQSVLRLPRLNFNGVWQVHGTLRPIFDDDLSSVLTIVPDDRSLGPVQVPAVLNGAYGFATRLQLSFRGGVLTA